MDPFLIPLGAAGLRQFQALRADAVSAVTERFYAELGSTYQPFGPRGRDACREDLTFHLTFLQPVLEFGELQPMVEYLCWLRSVLAARSIPAEHIALSLDMLGQFFADRMDAADGLAVTAAVQAARDRYLATDTMPVQPLAPHDAWSEALPFEAALLAGNQRDALSVVSRCIDNGHSLPDVELHVIQPSLHDIGEKWQANQITVAKEHMATAIAMSVMTVGLLRSSPPEPTGKRVLLACVAGNHHAVGLRMVADAFQLAGWDVQYLGADVPTRSIVEQTEEQHVDVIGLSVSFAHQLRTAGQVIGQLIERFGSARPSVVIGGIAINRFNRLGSLVGADAASADAQAAVVSANSLVGG
jgi:MerR family transcriptional regulator, light-induced transcriptional regulator